MIETGSLTKRYGCRAPDGLSSTVQPGAVTGLVGLGFGAVILHTAGAIGALTAVAFVLPLIVVDPPKVRSARGNAVPPRSGRSPVSGRRQAGGVRAVAMRGCQASSCSAVWSPG